MPQERIGKLVLLPGMNGRVSLYDSLRPHFSDLVTPSWIEPKRNEPLADYAMRVAEQLRPELPFTIGGTSFGGVIAHEVAGVLGQKGCLLISTVRGPEQLPPQWKLLRSYAERGEDALLEASLTLPADMPASETKRWRGLAHPAARFQRWATSALLTWLLSPATQRVSTWHLHGDCDNVFPIAFVQPDEIIAGGGHVLPVTHPERVAMFLQRYELRA